jgi:hypothetical protein
MHFFAAARPACMHIEVSVHVVDDPKGWRPDIFVSYSEHSKSVLKNLPMNQTFATPAEAEKAGIEFLRILYIRKCPLRLLAPTRTDFRQMYGL